MNTKGFTLIELVGVIVILGLILSITYTSINKSIETSETEINKAQKSNIEQSAKNWLFDNKSVLQNKLNADDSDISCSVSLDILGNGGYIEQTKIKDNNDCECVKITKVKNSEKYIYECSTDCSNECVEE